MKLQLKIEWLRGEKKGVKITVEEQAGDLFNKQKAKQNLAFFHLIMEEVNAENFEVKTFNKRKPLKRPRQPKLAIKFFLRSMRMPAPRASYFT